MGLAGEKPMIPAPPKVCPVRPEPVLPDELVPELDVPVVVAPAVVPVLPVLPVVPLVPPLSLDPAPLPDVPDVDVEPLPLSDEEKIEAPPKGELEPVEFEPPNVEVPADPLFPLRPLPPLGPTPAIVVAWPESGWPKKPIAVGVLFWPNRTGFQSSLPVMGSMYFLRRKADFVGLYQRVNVGRIGVELAVVELNGAAVLHAAMEGLQFAVTLDGLGNPGRGNRK